MKMWKKLVWLCFLFLPCVPASLATSAEMSNIFADVDPQLKGKSLDATVETIVTGALVEGLTAEQIMAMAKDRELAGKGLDMDAVLIMSLATLLNAPTVKDLDVEIAVKNLAIQKDIVELAKEKAAGIGE